MRQASCVDLHVGQKHTDREGKAQKLWGQNTEVISIVSGWSPLSTGGRLLGNQAGSEQRTWDPLPHLPKPSPFSLIPLNHLQQSWSWTNQTFPAFLSKIPKCWLRYKNQSVSKDVPDVSIWWAFDENKSFHWCFAFMRTCLCLLTCRAYLLAFGTSNLF